MIKNFAQFCQYCDAQNESKKWTAKSFQMSISKYLSLKANSRDRSNNGNVRYYDLGDSADKFIENLNEVWPRGMAAIFALQLKLIVTFIITFTL